MGHMKQEEKKNLVYCELTMVRKGGGLEGGLIWVKNRDRRGRREEI